MWTSADETGAKNPVANIFSVNAIDVQFIAFRSRFIIMAQMIPIIGFDFEIFCRIFDDALKILLYDISKRNGNSCSVSNLNTVEQK